MNSRFVSLALALLLVTGCSVATADSEDVPVSVTPQTTPVVVVPQPVPEPPPTVPPTIPVTVPATPPTTVAPVVVPAGDIADLVCSVFGAECDKALAVAWCESRHNPMVVGGAGERGLFQIHPVHIPYLADLGLTWEQMFDPVANTNYAYALWSRSGWGPWTCA
jgi:hypothetical protein